MAIIQGTGAFQGLDIDSVRCGSVEQMLQQLKKIHQDQCELFERITGVKVPNAAAIAAEEHDHDGVNSVPLSLPLAHGYLGAYCPAAEVSGAAEHAPLAWPCFYVPPGIEQVRVSVFTPAGSHGFLTNGDLLASTHDASIAYHQSEQQFQAGALSLPNGDIEVYADVDVEGGAVNMLRLDLWDGEYRRNWSGDGVVPQEPRYLNTYIVRAKVGVAHAVTPWSPPSVTHDGVIVPDSTYHLGAHAFTSFPEEFFDDYRSVNSYLLTSLFANAALLVELLHGVPAGANGVGHTNLRNWLGHNHKGDGTTSLDDSGVELALPLGAWNYGVGRKPPGAASGHADIEDPGASWFGRIFGASLIGSASTYYALAEHLVQLPDIQSSSKYGAGSKIKGAIWLYHDNGKSGGLDLRMRLENAAGTADGAWVTENTVTDGRQLITFDALDAEDADAEVNVQTLRIEGRQVNAGNEGELIYSSCLWFEP